MPPQTFSLTARWVFPVAGPPLQDGWVTVSDGQVKGVSQAVPGGPLIDLGNVALLPGLINAHTHLELSCLKRPIGGPGMRFPAWIRAIVACRRDATFTTDTTSGLAESLASGVVAVGDIASPGWRAEPYLAQPIAATVFQEAIGLAFDRMAGRLAEARQHLEHVHATTRLQMGLSPHAPYTIHPELFAGLIRLAEQSAAPLAFHLAESPEELELLASGSGPFVDLLSELAAWEPTAIARGSRPLDYLRPLAASRVRALMVHGNYLAPDEIELLARHASRLSVVYCPRTHAYFGHQPHPLPRLLAAGANVAVGTDSRASNPDLNLLSELRHIARHVTELAPKTVLELGTLRAAWALGYDSLGSIEPGKDATFAVVALPDTDSPDPYELLFGGDLPVTATIVRGQVVAGSL